MFFHEEKLNSVLKHFQEGRRMIALQGPSQTGKSEFVREISRRGLGHIIVSSPLEKPIRSLIELEKKIGKNFPKTFNNDQILLFDSVTVPVPVLKQLKQLGFLVIVSNQFQDFDDLEIEIIRFTPLKFSLIQNFTDINFEFFLRVGGMPEAIAFLIENSQDSYWELDKKI